MAKNKTNDDSEVVESLDILTDYEVLDSEKDWRMFSDTKALTKNIEALPDGGGTKQDLNDIPSPREETGGTHD